MKSILSRAQRFTNEIYLRHKILNKGGITYHQHLFIAEAIESLRPKKILEIGVQMGCTSAFLLRYLELTGLSDTELFSVDIISEWYQQDTKVHHKVGEEVDKHNAPKKNWKLLTNNVVAASQNTNIIGTDVELCILDTSHVYPGEILDFLMVLPMLKKNATLFIHDILMSRHSIYSDVTSMLFSAIPGEKSFPRTNMFASIKENIGKVILSSDIYNNLIGVFNLLTVEWQRPLSADFLNGLFTYFSNYYNKDCMDLFTHACYLQTKSDLKKLYHNSCPVCEDNAEKSCIPPLNTDNSCSRCNSSISQRILRKISHYMSINTEELSVLSDKTDTALPPEILEISKDIRDLSVYQDNFNLIMLNINSTNLDIEVTILDQLPKLLSPEGIAIVSLIDLSKVSIMNNEILESISSDSQKFKEYYKVNFAEIDCPTQKIETIYIISQSKVSIDTLFNIKQ